VHLKPNQALKHLNQGSEHTPGTFNAIPHCVVERLAKLAAATKDNENAPINLLHPKHVEALQKAGLNPTVHPTLKEALDEQAATTKATRKEKWALQAQRHRSVFLCIKCTKSWTKPVHAMLKRPKQKHGFSWLHIQMSCSRFQNLRELLQGDLAKKLREGAQSKDWTESAAATLHQSVKATTAATAKGTARNQSLSTKLLATAATWSALATLNNTANRG